MGSSELTDRFTFHPPKDGGISDAHEAVRSRIGQIAQWLNELLLEGREKSLAITKLEEAMFWANGSIARNQAVNAVAEPAKAVAVSDKSGSAADVRE